MPIGLFVGTVVADVHDHMGTWYLYTVIWSVREMGDNAPVGEIVGPTGRPSVTVITCSGAFERDRGRYLERHVVRAAPVVVTPPTGSSGDE